MRRKDENVFAWLVASNILPQWTFVHSVLRLIMTITAEPTEYSNIIAVGPVSAVGKHVGRVFERSLVRIPNWTVSASLLDSNIHPLWTFMHSILRMLTIARACGAIGCNSLRIRRYGVRPPLGPKQSEAIPVETEFHKISWSREISWNFDGMFFHEKKFHEIFHEIAWLHGTIFARDFLCPS
jgi:hypothetical protein